nr:MAG TPA: hypothetical protein [Caudoviricetes sp.]
MSIIFMLMNLFHHLHRKVWVIALAISPRKR